MPDFSVANVLLSAGVAALTTLGIEFAAKPSLEARKERILNKRREERELARRLIVFKTRMSDAAINIRSRPPKVVLADVVAASDALRAERELISQLCPKEIVLVLNYQLGYGGALLEASSVAEAIFTRNLPTDEEERRKADADAARIIGEILSIFEAKGWSEIPTAYLLTRRVHFLKRRKMRGVARTLNAERDEQRSAKSSAPEVDPRDASIMPGTLGQRSDPEGSI